MFSPHQLKESQAQSNSSLLLRQLGTSPLSCSVTFKVIFELVTPEFFTYMQGFA